MKLIEMNKIFENSNFSDKESKILRVANDADVQQFRELLSITEGYIDLFKLTEDHKQFYESVELFDKVIPEDVKEDVFYACKLGFHFEDVPSKLTYILNKALKNYDTPNVALSTIDKRFINKYLAKGAIKEDKSIKKVIESLVGKEVKLLTDSVRKVEARPGVWEIYIENTDRVLVAPDDIANKFNSLDDLKALRYDKELGIVLGDTNVILRTLNGRVGLTEDDYDLRDAI